MSDVAYIVWSLAVGVGLALLVVAARRRSAPTSRGWQEGVVAATLVMMGFSAVRLFGLALGDAALPSWSTPAKDLWIIAIGTSFIIDPQPNYGLMTSSSRPIFGYFLMAVGALSVAIDCFHLTAKA